jgi:hypothetical protein
MDKEFSGELVAISSNTIDQVATRKGQENPIHVPNHFSVQTDLPKCQMINEDQLEKENFEIRRANPVSSEPVYCRTVGAQNEAALGTDRPLKFEQRNPKSYILEFDGSPIYDDDSDFMPLPELDRIQMEELLISYDGIHSEDSCNVPTQFLFLFS